MANGKNQFILDVFFQFFIWMLGNAYSVKTFNGYSRFFHLCTVCYCHKRSHCILSFEMYVFKILMKYVWKPFTTNFLQKMAIHFSISHHFTADRHCLVNLSKWVMAGKQFYQLVHISSIPTYSWSLMSCQCSDVVDARSATDTLNFVTHYL